MTRCRVRKAEASDIPWISAELKVFSEGYGLKKKLYPGESEAHHRLCYLIDRHVVLIAEKDGFRSGFIVGLLTPHLFNSKIVVLQETLWWVPVCLRGTSVGKDLVDAFVDYGKFNADWVLMTLAHNTGVSDRTLERMGFRLVEKNFVMEV